MNLMILNVLPQHIAVAYVVKIWTSAKSKWKNRETRQGIEYSSSMDRFNQYMQAILKLLEQRGPGKTICPSEVLQGEEKKDSQKMEQIRAAGRRLHRQNKIEFTQRGKIVDPLNFKGPVRFRMKS